MGINVFPLGTGAYTNYRVISDADNFPDPVNNVITLEPNTAYLIAGTVDLMGARIVGQPNTTLFGLSPELSIIKSTGFNDANGAFLVTNYTFPMNYIAFHDFGAEQILDIDGDGNEAALDWYGINFLNCSNIGIVKNVNNSITHTMGYLNSSGLVYDGTIGTVSIESTIFTPAAGGSAVTLAATANITRRFRIIYSSFVVNSGETGINVDASATLPDEGYILVYCNFSGAGTYLNGIDYTSNKARFESNRGIINTSTVGHCYFVNNATTTTVTTSGTYYKVAGTTLEGTINNKFSHSVNRLTFTGTYAGYFEATASLSVATSINTNFSFRLAKNGITGESGEITIRQQTNVGYSAALVQDVFQLNTGDYIEVWVTASQNNSTPLISDLNLLIKRVTE